MKKVFHVTVVREKSSKLFTVRKKEKQEDLVGVVSVDGC